MILYHFLGMMTNKYDRLSLIILRIYTFMFAM